VDWRFLTHDGTNEAAVIREGRGMASIDLTMLFRRRAALCRRCSAHELDTAA